VIFAADAQAGTVSCSEWAIDCAAELHRAADLVLINDAQSVLPTGGTGWLPRFRGERIIHEAAMSAIWRGWRGLSSGKRSASSYPAAARVRSLISA
jgi:hypothetical protein